MSKDRLKRIEYLKRRARELRAIAGRMKEDHHKEILLTCATDYDWIAGIQKSLSEDCAEEQFIHAGRRRTLSGT